MRLSKRKTEGQGGVMRWIGLIGILHDTKCKEDLVKNCLTRRPSLRGGRVDAYLAVELAGGK